MLQLLLQIAYFTIVGGFWSPYDNNFFAYYPCISFIVGIYVISYETTVLVIDRMVVGEPDNQSGDEQEMRGLNHK